MRRGFEYIGCRDSRLKEDDTGTCLVGNVVTPISTRLHAPRDKTVMETITSSYESAGHTYRIH